MTDKGKRLGEDYDVVPSLMDVLSEAMEERGREARHIRYRFEKHERQIKRYLNRESFPTVLDLENLVAAVAIETGGDRRTYWHRALSAVDDEVTRLGRDPRMDAAAAVQALPSPETD